MFGDIKLYILNAISFGITMMDWLEPILEILLLLVTIGYTIHKWLNLKKNKLNIKIIEENISKLSPAEGEISENVRKEYGLLYSKTAKTFKRAWQFYQSKEFQKAEFLFHFSAR